MNSSTPEFDWTPMLDWGYDRMMMRESVTTDEMLDTEFQEIDNDLRKKADQVIHLDGRFVQLSFTRSSFYDGSTTVWKMAVPGSKA